MSLAPVITRVERLGIPVAGPQGPAGTAGSNGTNGGARVTKYAVDFQAIGPGTPLALPSNGTATIDGKVWTFVSQNGANASNTLSAAGGLALSIAAGGATPGAMTPLVDLASTIEPYTEPLEIWFRVYYANLNAASKEAYAMLVDKPNLTSSGDNPAYWGIQHGVRATSGSAWVARTRKNSGAGANTYTDRDDTYQATHDVVVLRLESPLRVKVFSGVYGSDWPDRRTLVSHGEHAPSPTDTEAIQPTMANLCAAIRTGNGTTTGGLPYGLNLLKMRVVGQ